jgi:hypothetical protein
MSFTTFSGAGTQRVLPAPVSQQGNSTQSRRGGASYKAGHSPIQSLKVGSKFLQRLAHSPQCVEVQLHVEETMPD